jgi:hypothetical protein
MKVIINGSLNINNSGGTTIGNSSSSITANTYSRVNKNGSINVNTDPAFGVPYSTNLTINNYGNPLSTNPYVTLDSVVIGGGSNFIIQQGTFPLYADIAYGNTTMYGHHFGGTSITINQYGLGPIFVYKNGIEQGGGDCINFFTGPFNFTFTENDIIIINGDYCSD